MLSNPRLAELVDELYFEPHVPGYGASRGTHSRKVPQRNNTAGTLKAIQVMQRLRMFGIRAHNWV